MKDILSGNASAKVIKGNKRAPETIGQDFKQIKRSVLKEMAASSSAATEAEKQKTQTDCLKGRAKKQKEQDKADYETVSICLNIPENNTGQGIIGILEGFGLLNEQEEGTSALNVIGVEVDGQNVPDQQADLKAYVNIPSVVHESEPLPEEEVKEIDDEKALLAKQEPLENANNLRKNTQTEDSPELKTEQNQAKSLKDTNVKGETIEIKREQNKLEDITGKSVQAHSDITKANSEENPAQEVKGFDQKELENSEQQIKGKMAQNITRLIDKISLASAKGVSEFSLDLKPEFLGKLTIKLMMDGDEIKAHIKAGDAMVKGMLDSELPALTQMLREKGLLVTQIEVALEVPAFDLNNGHMDSQDRDKRPNEKRRFKTPFKMETVDEIISALSDVHLEMKSGSVEFMA